MIDKLEAIRARFEDLGVALTNPAIVSDNRKFTQLSKEYRNLETIVKAYDQYRQLLGDIDFNREALMGDDAELRELAKAESAGLETRKEELEKYIRNLLIPKDPQDDKNAILEIRAGTGGDEASLFAGDLLRLEDLPEGGEPLPNPMGTAPGLCCPASRMAIQAVRRISAPCPRN